MSKCWICKIEFIPKISTQRYCTKKCRGGSGYRKIYRRTFGEIPKGWVIHHKDGNHNNNDINNLIAVTKE